MVEHSLSRRHFLSAAAATTAAWTAQSYARIVGANDRIRIGFIGVGGMGNAHLDTINQLKESDNVEAVAVADCWLTRARQGAAKVSAQHALQDYRKLLDIKGIDYVTIASPEHRHSQMTIDALDAGKAVYCEKPLTHTISEAQAVVKKQQATGLAVQVGVQGMSDDSYASAAKAIEQGMLGQVVQAQIDYVRRIDKQGLFRNPNVTDEMRKPDDLDWEAWLGAAPRVPWNPHHYHEWRCYSAYSGCVASDLFIHRLTRIMKACNLTYPRRVVRMGGIWNWPDGRDLPDNFEMICEYPRGMTVYLLGVMSNRVGVDHLIRGYRGTLYFTPTGWVARDKDEKVLATHTKTGGEDINLHHSNLHHHLRSGEPLNCPAALGLAGVAAVNMANESWRTSKVMAWDAMNERMVPADTLHMDHSPVPSEDA
jgi:predicted dehydrogenase